MEIIDVRYLFISYSEFFTLFLIGNLIMKQVEIMRGEKTMKKTMRLLMAMWMIACTVVHVGAVDTHELTVNAMKPTAFDSIQEGEEKEAVLKNSAAIETVKVENGILYISAKADQMVGYHLGGSPSEAKWFPLLLSFTNKNGDGIAVNIDGTAGNTDQAPYFGGVEGRDTVQWFGVLNDGSNLNGKVLTYTDRTSGNEIKLTIEFLDTSDSDVTPDQPKPDPDDPTIDTPNLDDPNPDLPDDIYGILGNGTSFDGVHAMTFVSNDEFENFIMVRIDEKELDPKYYTVEKGSIKVTLHVDYLKTLSKGVHKIEIVSKNAAVMGEFEVPKEAQNSNPSNKVMKDTSQTNMWFIYFAGLLGVIGVSAIYICSQHRKKDA